MRPYQGRKVTVAGLARSGMAAALLLKSQGARVCVTEKNKTPLLEAQAANLESIGIDVELGRHSRLFVEGSALLVISPGVRIDSEVVLWAKELGIEVISEIELASSLCPAPVIAVTGTNGKTTTTTLIAEVVRASGRRSHALGNIGTPFSSALPDIDKEDFVCLEVSSFQLETIKNFRPRLALILNITPDHLDRYEDLGGYVQAKKRVFMNQGEGDCLILNYADAYLRGMALESKARVLFFNKDESPGDFNLNQMAVLAAAGALGIDKRFCLEVFGAFKGVEHRMEFVRNLYGIEFINDSKATNIGSTVWALKNINKPAVLIAGGRDKAGDFSSIKGLVAQKAKFAVVLGEAAERIRRAWEGAVPIERAADLGGAVVAARSRAASGDVVLFSPMCKSFDMFSDYEHRGRVFKESVMRLA